MSDIFTQHERSKLMSRIRGNDLGPEVRVRAVLRRMRVKFVTNCPDLPGRPDVVIPDLDLIVFVHGCFWHGCPRHYRAPKTRRKWWRDKLNSNRRRDARVARRLRRMGWSVWTIWEHDTTDLERLSRRIESITRRKGGNP